jgi:integrase
MFKWAVRRELVSPHVHQALLTVPALREGRAHGARETDPRLPATDEQIAAITPFVPPVVRDMIAVQRLCGARPGELVIKRSCDFVPVVDFKTILFVPETSKLKHLKKQRVLAIGPRTQEILKPYIARTNPTDYLFKPPTRSRVGRYTVNYYHHVIDRACRRAGVQEFCPQSIRHSTATAIEGQFDLDKAKDVLGHFSTRTTRGYTLHPGLKNAVRLMEEIG